MLKVALLGAVLLLSGCGYNTLQQQDEGVTAAWSEVVNQYQRRADLIPNLVETVKGFADAGADGADRRHRSARQSRHPSSSRPSCSTTRLPCASSRRRRANSPRR